MTDINRTFVVTWSHKQICRKTVVAVDAEVACDIIYAGNVDMDLVDVLSDDILNVDAVLKEEE